jgi:hypothetical protein
MSIATAASGEWYGVDLEHAFRQMTDDLDHGLTSRLAKPLRPESTIADRPPPLLRERAVPAQRPQRFTRSQGQSVASQLATASASGTSRLDLSARTQDCTVTSQSSEAEGYR